MELELRSGPPSSARVLGQPIPRHQQMIDAAEVALAQPIVGVVTSDGPVPRLYRLAATGVSTEPLRRSVERYRALLDPVERSKSSFPIDSDRWRRWCNLNRFLMRDGCCLDDLGPDKRRACLDAVGTALSVAGRAAVRGVMQLNETVQELTGRRDGHGFSEFGEWLYWMSCMGEPSTDEPWGWQLDGHHLSVNCLVVGDQMVLTPFFLGSEPLVAERGKFAGVRVLEFEERYALDLVQSLDDAQRRVAVVSSEMPPGLFTGAFSDNVTLDYAGIAYGALTTSQREHLLALISVYVNRMEAGHARVKWDEITEHLEDTYFCWMGGTADTDVFYYRIQSPVVLVEFDHEPGIVFKGTAPMKSHVHSILRTPNGNDYGADLIRQHRAQVRHYEVG